MTDICEYEMMTVECFLSDLELVKWQLNYCHTMGRF
jgi:hypothetical protein